jgi:hypothetical protein
MIIARALRANRTWLGLGLLGVLPLFAGCDTGDPNTKPQAPPQPAAQQESEAAARAKGAPTKPGGPAAKTNGAAPAEKTAEKSAEKTAEKPAPPKQRRPIRRPPGRIPPARGAGPRDATMVFPVLVP